MHILIRKMSLQTLLEPAPVPFRPFFRTFDQRMEMGIIHRYHPDPYSCDFSTDGYTVPAKYFIFHGVKWNVRPRAI